MTQHVWTDAELDAYLDEALASSLMARIEAQLRGDADLRARLVERIERRDHGLHDLGSIWRRHRISCPTREQLGSFLLGVLDDDHADYVRFHLDMIGCRYCQANLEDLRQQHEDQPACQARSRKYFQSSRGRLPRRRE